VTPPEWLNVALVVVTSQHEFIDQVMLRTRVVVNCQILVVERIVISLRAELTLPPPGLLKVPLL